jgi:hypothetical protein
MDPAFFDSTIDADSKGPVRKRERTEKNNGQQIAIESL